MALENEELLAIIISPAFVVSATSLVRKYVPAIDGWKSLAFVFGLSELVCVSERLLSHPSQWGYGVVAGAVLAVTSLGANEKLNELARRITLPGSPVVTLGMCPVAKAAEATKERRGAP